MESRHEGKAVRVGKSTRRLKPIIGESFLNSLLRRKIPCPASKFPAPVRKVPCRRQQGICRKSLAIQHQLVPKPSTLRRFRKDSLQKSLPTGNLTSVSTPRPKHFSGGTYARSRNNLRITLPVVVIGILSMKATSRGYSCADRRCLTKSWISAASSSDGGTPGLSTTNALTISVRSGSGLPTAAASAK